MELPLESLGAFRAFRDRLDGLLAQAWERYQDQMQCKAGCFGCCKRDFRVSLVEALEIRTAVEALAPPVQQQIEANAQQPEEGLCPLLIQGQCSIYASRPLICRMFGFPISNGESIGTCELNFQEAQNQDYTAQCFDGPLIGKALQDLSRIYLKETGQPLLKEDEAPPMLRITEILALLKKE